MSEATVIKSSSAKRSTKSDTNTVDDELSSTTQTSNAKPNRSDLKISCIEEERLGLGIGDFAEMFITPVSSSGNQVEVEVQGPFEVVQVDNSKTAILRLSPIDGTTSYSFDNLVSAAKQGRVTVKKVRTDLSYFLHRDTRTSILHKNNITFHFINNFMLKFVDKNAVHCGPRFTLIDAGVGMSVF